MQGDGNLVAYLDPGVYGTSAPIWNSGTWGHSGAYAVMQGDGNLVVYQPGSPPRPLWNSRTSGHPGAYAVMQGDGNLVVYKAFGSTIPLWYSNTYGTTGTSNPGYCTGLQTVFGFVWKACMYSTVWHNGTYAGVLSPSSLVSGCAGVDNWTCPSVRQGSYLMANRVNEDWVNQVVEHKGATPSIFPNYNEYYCWYLRVDTSPNGSVSYQTISSSGPYVTQPTCN
jgi:hypothetical protein